MYVCCISREGCICVHVVHMLYFKMYCLYICCIYVVFPEKDVFVYLLGFANISMDNPDMKGFQQIMISSSEDAIARSV